MQKYYKRKFKMLMQFLSPSVPSEAPIVVSSALLTLPSVVQDDILYENKEKNINRYKMQDKLHTRLSTIIQ